MKRYDCGGDRAVLALHCSLAHGGAWSGIAGHLAGVTLLAPDLPGHGAEPLWDGRTDLHAAATRQGIRLAEAAGQVDLLGHSLGATVALRIALERPELVRSLMLIEPVLFAAARAAESPAFRPFVARQAQLLAACAAGDAERAVRHFMADWGDGADWDSLPRRQQVYFTDRIDQVASMNDVLVQDAAGLLGYMRLESLGVPVLLLEGSESPPVIGAIQAELHRRLPLARRHQVPGVAHMAPVTHPVEVAAVLQAHLDAV